MTVDRSASADAAAAGSLPETREAPVPGWGAAAGTDFRGIVTGSIPGASSGTSIAGEPAGARTERAAARTVDRSTRRRRWATAPSSARAQMVLIRRGTPDDR